MKKCNCEKCNEMTEVIESKGEYCEKLTETLSDSGIILSNIIGVAATYDYPNCANMILEFLVSEKTQDSKNSIDTYTVRSMLLSVFEDKATQFINLVSISLEKMTNAIISDCKDDMPSNYRRYYENDDYCYDRRNETNFSINERFSFIKNLAICTSLLDSKEQVLSVLAAIVSHCETLLTVNILPTYVLNSSKFKESFDKHGQEFNITVLDQLMALTTVFAKDILRIGGSFQNHGTNNLVIPVSTHIDSSVPIQFHEIASSSNIIRNGPFKESNKFVKPIVYGETSSVGNFHEGKTIVIGKSLDE